EDFTFGDPKSLIKGQELRPNLFLEDNEIRNGQWRSFHVVRFSQSETSDTNDEVKAQSYAAADWDFAPDRSYRFLQRGDSLVFRPTDDSGAVFKFKRDDRGTWRLIQIGATPAQMVHFSRNADAGVMSLLVMSHDRHGGSNLIAFYFTQFRDY